MAEIEYTKRNTESVFEIATDVIQTLTSVGATIGIAESLTGGGLIAALTSVPGASVVVRGGVAAYATKIKVLVLGVDPDLIANQGVISGEVATQMAEGARRVTTLDTPTTWGIGTTGVAGPTLQDGKPIGTVFIGIASPDGVRALGPYLFPGSRDRVREATIIEALWQLRQRLREAA